MRSDGPSYREITAAALACFLVATLITWPLVLDPFLIVMGHPRCTNLIHVWTLWAFAQNISQGELPIISPHIFHPVGANIIRLYGSDLLYPTLLAPLQQWLAPEVVFNLRLFSSFWLAPLSMWGLLRWLGVSGLAAFVGATLFIMSPFFLLESLNGVNELVAVEWLPLAVWMILKSLESLQLRYAALAALFSILSVYANGYSAFFLLIFGLIAVLHHLLFGEPPLLKQSRVGQGVAVLMVATLGALPYVALHQTGDTHGALTAESRAFTKANTAPTADAAADLLRFFRPGRNNIPETFVRDDGRRDKVYTTYTTYLGFTTLTLALWSLRRRHPRTRLWVWGAMGFFAIALGPYLRVGGTTPTVGGAAIGLPTLLLYDLLPGFAVTARHTYRYVTMVHLCLAVLAAFGVQHLLSRWPDLKGRLLAAGGILTIAGLEILRGGPAPWPIPHTQLVVPPFYAELAASSTPGAIIELPFTRNHLRDLQRYLFFQTRHGRPWIDGAMQFRVEPSSLGFVNEVPMAQNFLAEGTINDPLTREAITTSVTRLKEAGFKYILVHDQWFDQEEDNMSAHTWLSTLFGPPRRTPGDVAVYEIKDVVGYPEGTIEQAESGAEVEDTTNPEDGENIRPVAKEREITSPEESPPPPTPDEAQAP